MSRWMKALDAAQFIVPNSYSSISRPSLVTYGPERS